MLKAVSSVANAIGALNYKGAWDADTNTPALVSGVGSKGDYYVVSVAGATVLDGISNWGFGDWAVFNGSVWERMEGGADLNGVNLSVSGTSTLSGLTASTALALNGSKEIVSVTNSGSGDNVLAASPSIATPTLTGDVTLSTGNLVIGTSGKGIDFSVTGQAGGMTSELLDDYEEGTWTPDFFTTGPDIVPTSVYGRYTKVGNLVTAVATLTMPAAYPTNYGQVVISLPLVSANTQEVGGGFVTKTTATQVAYMPCRIAQNSSLAYFQTINAGAWDALEYNGRTPQLGLGNTLTVFFNYFVD